MCVVRGAYLHVPDPQVGAVLGPCGDKVASVGTPGQERHSIRVALQRLSAVVGTQTFVYPFIFSRHQTREISNCQPRLGIIFPTCNIPEGETLGHGVEVPDHDGVVLGARGQARAVGRPLAVPHLVTVLVQHLSHTLTFC